MDPNLKVKKCLGSSYGGTIYLIKNSNKRGTKNTKLICKHIPLSPSTSSVSSSSVTKPYIQKYYKLMEKIYHNHSVRQFINPMLEYKIKNDDLYVLFPHYTGYSLEQLKKRLLKMDNKNYKIIMKHLVKKILTGLATLHKQGIYHQKLNTTCIIVNTNTIRIKFYDLSINNSTKKKRTKKLNKKYIKLKNKDCMDCGHLLLDLISFKYIEDYNNSNDKGLLNKALNFFNIKKREKEIDEIVDKDFVVYMNIINDKMIKKQENIDKVLRDILFKEKYKD